MPNTKKTNKHTFYIQFYDRFELFLSIDSTAT